MQIHKENASSTWRLKLEQTKKESIGNLVDTPHLFFYLLTTFDVPLVALYTLCVSSPFAQDNEVDGRMKSRKMICRPSTYRQNLFGMGDGIISWWRTIFAPLLISSLFLFFPFLHAARPGGLKKKSQPTPLCISLQGRLALPLESPLSNIRVNTTRKAAPSLCVTVAIFQQPLPPPGKCVEIFHLRLFPNKNSMGPDWFHPFSEWAALLTWVAFWLAKSIEQVAVEILLNSRGGKNPRTRGSCWDDAQVFNRSQHFVGDGSGRGEKNQTFVKWKPTIFESLIGSPCSILASNMGHRSSSWSFS